MLYKNPERVSRLYGADGISPEALELPEYEVISPVEHEVEGGAERYTVFVPPNLDSSGWALDGGGPRRAFTPRGRAGAGKLGTPDSGRTRSHTSSP